MSDNDRKITGGLGVFIAFCLLGVLISKRQFADMMFMIVGGVALLALIVVLLSGPARKRRAEGRTRSKARALRQAQWRPVLGLWGGEDAILLRRATIVDDEEVLAEPDRLFEKVRSAPESPAYDGEVAEIMGRADLRAGTLNARI